MDVGNDHPEEISSDLESREPSVEDLVNLCRHLNDNGARYIVIGGFAIRAAGYDRRTMDIDLLIDTDLENEARVYKALEFLPDQAVKELAPGEVSRYTVVRVADEIVVDLMRSACGIDYDNAKNEIDLIDVEGVKIPFANKRLLWKLKQTYRAKDIQDRQFLEAALANEGIALPTGHR